MFCRLAATIFAGALVLVPPVRAGLDIGLVGNSSHEASFHARHVPFIEPSSGSQDEDEDAREGRASPAVATFGFGPKTAFFPSDGPRELVLTFDDGPDLKFTPLVLAELDRRGLKAVFFVTGHRVIGDRPEDLARRELLGRIAAHGHMVANHTMTHRDLCLAPDEAAAEIDQNSEVIAQSTGVRPLLFRAPYGARCRKLEADLVARQLVSVGWNLDPQDWRKPTIEEILVYLQTKLSHLHGRGILLLHDTHPASVFALGPLLDWIARDNRAAVREHRAPIVMRDYSVFLPVRAVPRTGIAAVAASLADNILAAWTPNAARPPFSSVR